MGNENPKSRYPFPVMLHMYGFLLIDKPVDWTSHDVVAYLRGLTKIKKIGHAGTLDPFATGLLIVGVSRAATKRLDEFKGMPKTYESTIHLGATSDTQDLTGNITIQQFDRVAIPTESQVTDALSSFVGKQTQIPPMYSAKKIKGKKLYEIARKGGDVERDPVDIEIFSLDLIDYTYPEIKIRTTVSTGTYIRTLAHDIGSALDVGGYCSELRRTQIGIYNVSDASPPKSITTQNYESLLRTA